MQGSASAEYGEMAALRWKCSVGEYKTFADPFCACCVGVAYLEVFLRLLNLHSKCILKPVGEMIKH